MDRRDVHLCSFALIYDLGDSQGWHDATFPLMDVQGTWLQFGILLASDEVFSTSENPQFIGVAVSGISLVDADSGVCDAIWIPSL